MNKKPLVVLIDGPAFTHRWFYRWEYANKMSPLNVQRFALQNAKALVATAQSFTLENIHTATMPTIIEYSRLTHKCNRTVIFYDQGDAGRTKLYPAYKLERRQRVKGPELTTFFHISREFFRTEPKESLLQIPDAGTFAALDAEADDTIATTSLALTAKQIPHIVMTHDIDVMHVVNDKAGVVVYDPRTKELLNEEKIEQRVGVKPNQIVDFKTLVGDKSDNIPGVTYIGKKRAVDLLKKYGSLERLLADGPKEQKGRMLKVLQTCSEEVALAQSLVKHKHTPEVLEPVFQFIK